MAAIQIDKKLSVLYTVGPRQQIPKCSRCSTSKCPCLKSYNSIIKDLEENTDENVSVDSNLPETNAPESKHYQSSLPREMHILAHGHNFTKFPYPIERDDHLSMLFRKRIKVALSIPSKLLPTYKDDLVCQHGHKFKEEDDKCILLSEKITIFLEDKDLTIDCKNYARPSVGNCLCQQQMDTHEHLLWNLGKLSKIENKHASLDYNIHCLPISLISV